MAMAQWDEGRAQGFVRGVVGADSWPAGDSLEAAQSAEWVAALVEGLQRPGKTAGQCLVLATASKLEDAVAAANKSAAPDDDAGHVPAAAAAAVLSDALKREKQSDRDMREKRNVAANAKRRNVGGLAFRAS